MVPHEGEQLTTGWEPDLPPEDTLVRQAVLVHASWPVAVAGAAGRPRRSAARWAGGWIGDRGALTNPVILTQPMMRAGDALEEINALFPLDVPYLLLSPWPTPNLREFGFALIGHPPLMVRFPGLPARTRRWPGEVREIRDPSELTVAERVLVEGYPMPELDPLTPGDLLGPHAPADVHADLARLAGRRTGRGGRRSFGGRGHPCRVRCHPSRRAWSRRGRGGDVGGHPRRPGPPRGADRQRRRQTGLLANGLPRRGTVDRLATPGAVAVLCHGRRFSPGHS